MTRANINYIYQNSGEAPRTLFFYWNGDQYPSGIRDLYNVLDFTTGDMTADNFKKWAIKREMKNISTAPYKMLSRSILVTQKGII